MSDSMQTFVIAMGFHCLDIQEKPPVQIGTASKYPLHVSIKGRFLASKELIYDELVPALQSFQQSEIVFSFMASAPCRISSNLYWREVLSGNPGFTEFCDFHNCIIEFLLSKNIVDVTPASYQRVFFRPHVTIAWKENFPVNCAEEKLLRTQNFPMLFETKNMVIFKYYRNPHIDTIEWAII